MRAIFALIIAAVVIFGCLTAISNPCFWGAASCNGTVSTSPTQPIQAIQPQGFPQRDQQNAQTNVDNMTAERLRAESDKLYAEAERIRALYPAESEVMLAQAEELRAKACAIRSDCGLQNYLQGEDDGFKQGQNDVLVKIFLGILGFVILLLAIGKVRG